MKQGKYKVRKSQGESLREREKGCGETGKGWQERRTGSPPARKPDVSICSVGRQSHSLKALLVLTSK